MKYLTLSIAIVVAAIGSVVAHEIMSRQPIMRMRLQEFFYQQSGLNIAVPDTENTYVEVYTDFVLIIRPNGVQTIVPNHRIHAIDVRDP